MATTIEFEESVFVTTNFCGLGITYNIFSWGNQTETLPIDRYMDNSRLHQEPIIVTANSN